MRTRSGDSLNPLADSHQTSTIASHLAIRPSANLSLVQVGGCYLFLTCAFSSEEDRDILSALTVMKAVTLPPPAVTFDLPRLHCGWSLENSPLACQSVLIKIPLALHQIFNKCGFVIVAKPVQILYRDLSRLVIKPRRDAYSTSFQASDSYSSGDFGGNVKICSMFTFLPLGTGTSVFRLVY